MRIFNLLQTKFVEYENAIKNYLSLTLSRYSSTYGPNTIFGQFMTVLNSIVQNMMLYIEDSLVEQNIYTAQRKKSIYGLAALSGYNPDYGKAAGVLLDISYTPNNLEKKDVLIKNGERLVCSQNGLNYTIILPQETMLMSYSDTTSKQVYAVQGNYSVSTTSATGGRYYSHNIKFTKNLDVKYLNVYVNGELWKYAASVYDMLPNGKEWTWKTNPINGIDIIFGNGTHGKIINHGDYIEARYIIHEGEGGNLNPNAETYFVFDNPLSTINGDTTDGNAIFNVTFANGDAVTSGTNSESTVTVKHMIGLNSRGMVLATPDNYKHYLSRFSFCGYNKTWGEVGSLVINSLIIKNFKNQLLAGGDYFDLTESDFKLTDYQKKSLITSIENSGAQMAGVTYNIFDPELCKYAMYVYLKMKTTDYEKAIINNKIRSLISDFMLNIQTDYFIPKSDIIQLIKNNISEVDGVDVYFLSEKNETAMQTRQYTDIDYKYDMVTGGYNITEKVVHLYPGEDPNLGLDKHGNIILESDFQFPVIMGGWDYLNKQGNEVVINNPLTIIYD